MREILEYTVETFMSALADAERREIVMAFRTNPTEDEHDVAIRMQAGIVAALVTGLHGAAAKLDMLGRDRTMVVQPLPFRGARALDPAMEQCALQLEIGGLQIPVLLSAEAVPRIVNALQEAVARLESPSARRLT